MDDMLDDINVYSGYYYWTSFSFSNFRQDNMVFS